MELKIFQHKLVGARQVHSPNHSTRPTGCEIDLLIIHNISLPPGEFGTDCVEALFCNRLDYDSHPYFEGIRGLRVSSHLLINRQGEISQYVPFNLKAWHAGESEFKGRQSCNDYSIGIELEGTDDELFTDAQYTSLIRVTRLLLQEYPNMSVGRIVGHSDVAPGRKTDPGPCFDWDRYKRALTDGETQ